MVHGVHPDDDDAYFLNTYSHSRYYPHEGNSSITTSVTIHVTPEHYHLFNWALLWSGFILGILLASYQVHLENRWFASKEDQERRGVDLEHHQQQSPIPEGEGVISSADWTRRRFRRLLLLAMVSRAIMIPVQIWVNPIWAQFVADTIPEMTFASAWTLLVSFFVQLVGVASGVGNATSPGLVIQITAYIVYLVVLGIYFVNPVATVLLYALLCCIYAALFGTTLYFCPRLLMLLQPSLALNSQLAIRLAASSVLCVIVFGGRTFGFAQKVVAPPRSVSWWWQYGVLELIPSILFLVMMHPRSPTSGGNNISDENDVGNDNHQTRGSFSASNASHGRISFSRSSSPGGSGTPPTPGPVGAASRKSQDSYGSRQQRSAEATPLLLPGVAYGTNSHAGGSSVVASSGGDAAT